MAIYIGPFSAAIYIGRYGKVIEKDLEENLEEDEVNECLGLSHALGGKRPRDESDEDGANEDEEDFPKMSSVSYTEDPHRQWMGSGHPGHGRV